MNHYYLIFLLCLFSPSIVLSQYKVGGSVMSEEGEPLPGVAILDSKDSLLSVTDEQGIFDITLPDEDFLLFQHVSHYPKQFRVKNSSDNLIIRLASRMTLLEEVNVISFEADRALRQVAGGIGVLQPQDINRFDETSLVPVMNQIPGVRMEQRSTGSYRISIRGSALRAPFDVRNVKVYWNNIPITEPGGNTPFNLLDNSNFGRIEVIKGPAGSIYGAGIGGVINIQSDTPENESRTVSSSFTTGSFGLQRYTLSGNVGDERKAVRFSYAKQKTDGYRQHSALDRQNLALNASFKTGENSKLNADILYTDLFYEIPGGLTREQFDEDPQQARPGNPFVLGSEEANASIDVKNLLVGLTYDAHLSEKVQMLTTVYTNQADFVNPFNLDYKREGQQGYGGRTRLNVFGNLGSVDTKLILGGEYQNRFASARNYGNNMGLPDTLNFDDELRTRQYMFFGQYEVFLPSEWILTAGLSVNNVEYDIYRLIDNTGNGASGTRIVKNFDTQWIPRVSILKAWNETSIYGSISTGFSPPTLEEVRTNEGSVNTAIQPEQGINYEVGVRGNRWADLFSYSVSAFYLRLAESIVDYPSDRGTDLFRNAGSTHQKGLEIAGNLRIIKERPVGIINALDFSFNYSYHHFRFDEYVQGEEDFSGNELPGVAPHTLWTGISLGTDLGFYFNLNYNFTDEIPLDNINEVYSNSYHLVLGRMGIKREIARGLIADLYFGGDNLLDQKYSLGNDLNAFGGRFFQPAPERNYYGGISVNYRF